MKYESCGSCNEANCKSRGGVGCIDCVAGGQKCVEGNTINRYVRDNYYNIPALQNNIPNNDIVLGGVISSRQSAYSIGNMSSPYLSTKNRVYRYEPPSTYDNQAITSMENFTPYSND